MISMSSIKSAGGTSKYMSGQAAAEYYAGQQVPSQWLGQGAEHQGLAGREVAESDLTKQLEGKVIEFNKISGQWEEIQLGVQRGGGLQHRAGWDLTFSAPKSVSLEAEVFGNADVRAAHERAVSRAMGFLEDQAAQARIAGNFVQTKSLCYVTFAHATSRAGDPQTHTHAIIANVTYSDGKAYSLSNEKLLDYRTTADVVYKNELAHALEKSGYAVEWDKSGNFEIAGYSREDLAIFSKRSEEIKGALARRGMDKDTASHAARQIAALDTRQDKDQPESADTHRDRWQAEAAAVGINQTLRGTSQKPTVEALQQSARAAVLSAVNHLTEREQAFRERDLWKESARFSQGGTNTDRLEEAMLALIHEGSLIVRSDGKYTTSDAVESEKTMGERLAAGHGAHEAVMSHREFDHALRLFEERKGFALSGEQRAAARMILTGEDRYQGVQGLAGTGKTTLLELVREAAESRGWEVKGFSNGGAQADKMQQESGIASTTTARHLIDSDQIIRAVALAARALDTHQKNSGPFGEVPNFKELSKGVDKGTVKLEFDGEKRAYFTDKNGHTWTKCLYDKTTQIETGDATRYSLTSKGVYKEGAGGREKTTQKEAVAARAQCALETARNRSAALVALQAQAVRANGENRKTLQVCDEASMSGQKEINRVINTTRQQGAKTIFLGDENQHQSVAAGKGFELAQNHMPMSVLGQSSIRRQTTGRAKDAVGKILEGKHGEAVRGLHTKETSIAQDAVRATAAAGSRTAKDNTAYRAALKEAAVADNKEVIRRLAQDYCGMDRENRDKTLVITATNEDRNAINDAAREALKGRGELQDGRRMDMLEKTGCTEEELKRATTFEKGQMVEFTGKDNTLAVDKGERATVLSADSRTNIVTARTESGREIRFDPAKVQGRELYDMLKGKEFAVDDKVAITRNDKRLKVLKGQTGSVMKIEGSLLTVKLESGQTRVFDAEKYKYIGHAYAVTSYKAQGQTIDKVMLHHNTEGGRHGDRETYVNVTRAREDVIVYTQNSDKAALQSGQKLDKEQAMPVAVKINESQTEKPAAERPEHLLPEGHRQPQQREPAQGRGFELGR
ncbi:MAG: MobF family relaxase [Candidatus Nitrotoga sp.]